MAATRTGARPGGGTRNFITGMLIGMIAIVTITLGALFELGYFAPGPEEVKAPHVFTSEDLTDSAPKPTAVWRFRQEWLTPRPK